MITRSVANKRGRIAAIPAQSSTFHAHCFASEALVTISSARVRVERLPGETHAPETADFALRHLLDAGPLNAGCGSDDDSGDDGPSAAELDAARSDEIGV
jgi:hypothetical protein